MLPSSPCKSKFSCVFKVAALESEGLLENKNRKALMDWSVKDLLAIQLNSYVYFHQENSKIDSYINLNEDSNSFSSNFLNDIKFDFSGDLLTLVDSFNNINLYDTSNQ